MEAGLADHETVAAEVPGEREELAGRPATDRRFSHRLLGLARDLNVLDAQKLFQLRAEFAERKRRFERAAAAAAASVGMGFQRRDVAQAQAFRQPLVDAPRRESNAVCGLYTAMARRSSPRAVGPIRCRR